VNSLEKYDEAGNRERVAWLRERGVETWGPERVYIAADVALENIEPGATIHQATIAGPSTLIGKGTSIGLSGHALIRDCQIGRNVSLGAGTYEGATILDGASVRGFAEIRPGTLLEEDVEAAHNVAFKNTVLTATMVTGSLINYCDIFMSGGSSRTVHGEVGSGVVHFNFDPRGDKYSSLVGDVRGVLLRSAPIFIGGQCGIVAPLHIDFGTVIAAGSVLRADVGPERVKFEGVGKEEKQGFDREIYSRLRRKFITTAQVVGNLRALGAWYSHVRLPFADGYQKPLYESAIEQTKVHIAERVRRIKAILEKLERSIEKSTATGNSSLIACQVEHRLLLQTQDDVLACLEGETPAEPPTGFVVRQYERLRRSASHVDAVRGLDESSASAAARWLKQIADASATRMAAIFRA
jgi:UDP-N-acetylglucosamine/UDP-N-acetylgalactosamine diphosphorylase